MTLRRLLTLSLVWALPTGATAVAQDVSTPAEVTAFIGHLDTCSPGTARTPHPLMTSFVVEHSVVGETDGTCGYRQTMPGNMTMVCALTPDGRKALAADLGAMAAGGALRGGTTRAPPVWMSECQIELQNGTRLPAVQPRRPGR